MWLLLKTFQEERIFWRFCSFHLLLTTGLLSCIGRETDVEGSGKGTVISKVMMMNHFFSKRPDVKVCCIVREVIDNAKKVAGCKIRNEPNQNPKARGHKKGLREDQMILKTTSNSLLYKPCSACPQWRQTCS